MTDRELLELAAKAAGIEGQWKDHGGALWLLNRPDGREAWNPLANDGDALRLAIKLNLLIIEHYCYFDERRQKPATVKRSGDGMVSDLIVSFPTYAESFQQYDPYAATRRAIVRAAAEIGKSMK